MEDCIFCKIVKEEIPTANVYEDEDFLAFLDIKPVSNGHTLIIPKEHYQWMEQVPDDKISSIYLLTKKIMSTLKTKLSCDYVQVSVVGEEVPHFHIHLIPRHFHDGLSKWTTHEYSSIEEMNEIAKKIIDK